MKEEPIKINPMKKKIKVLESIRQGKIGGGETHVLDLISHIDKTQFEPIVLSFTKILLFSTNSVSALLIAKTEKLFLKFILLNKSIFS